MCERIVLSEKGEKGKGGTNNREAVGTRVDGLQLDRGAGEGHAALRLRGLWRETVSAETGMRAVCA